MRQGAFVILYESKDQTSLSPPSLSKRDEGVVTVISSDLVCSKVPMEYVCDVDVLRERVRARQLYDEEQSFDLWLINSIAHSFNKHEILLRSVEQNLCTRW